MKKAGESVVWITGASSGIGSALAREYSRLGARCILTARNREKLEEVRKQCPRGESGVAVLPGDLGRIETIPELAKKAVVIYGRIDILINNAGVSQRSLVHETSIDVYKDLFNVNVLGTIALTREILPEMIRNRSGQIVAVSSIAGKFGTPLRSGYCATKHALHGFFDSLRAEVWQYGISVSLVVPGFVQTDISRHAFTGSGGFYGKMDENQAGAVSPEDAARAIVRNVAAYKREFRVGMNGKSRLALFLAAFFPGLLARILRTARIT